MDRSVWKKHFRITAPLVALALWALVAMPAETMAKDAGAGDDAASASPIGGVASAGSSAPNLNLIFSVSEATQAPTIDGKLEEPVLACERSYDFWGALKPTMQPGLDFNYINARITETASGPELYSGYFARNKLTCQFTKRLFQRLSTQYDDFSKSLEVDSLLATTSTGSRSSTWDPLTTSKASKRTVATHKPRGSSLPSSSTYSASSGLC